ncbi:hypothetical protein [Geobacillus subterraneus]|uniref:hypothetical protein n=1 Tax=Geobacillus TaxID=129337 RepID=UPI001442B022|nr:hypothetical protein [Geobacillus subterraneus]QIZ67539.1 hypothetical protein HF500_10000 [Geobacillus subterraneus]WJQ01590.1 hypothetical protein QT234_07250 [Geobacillus stearothermophilus]WJQ04991.1 hypothetical protein QT236_07065 [Geobacillus stearothermophilus]WPZ19716.1 hypothetical protein UM396_07395 [Geobacillus subterraneus]
MKPHTPERDAIEGGGGQDGAAALARYGRRQQARVLSREKRKKQYRFIGWLLFAIAVFWGAGALIWSGYGALKTTAGREIAIMRLKEAIEDRDAAALQALLRVADETAPINGQTLTPLFAYFDQHPEAYETLDKEFARQREGGHVYIKGLTSHPPVFTIHVFENRYVFEPALYFVHVRLDDPEATLVVNGREVKGGATKDPFIKKIGPYLPGVYTVTAVDPQGKKKTVRVELFGGARVREIDITK